MSTGAMLGAYFAICGAAALFALAAPRGARAAIRWAGLACGLLLMAAASARLLGAGGGPWRLWRLAGAGSMLLHVDALAAVFLFTAGLVYVPCCWFAADQLADSGGARRFAVLHFALMAAVAWVLTAGDAVGFLIAWECMSVLCYLLVNERRAAAQDARAGFLLLAMGEGGFLAVAVAFLILAAHAPGLSFASLRQAGQAASAPALWAILVLGLFGFGVKAGLVPVNTWLPRSYRAAPAAFVPVLAGVTLNLGLYGVLRLNGDLAAPHHPGAGLVIMAVGSVTAVIGILYACTENDLKAMLAHSSIENSGVIVAAAGAYLVFRADAHPIAAAVALTAALYHLINHSVYKALLYQGAGQMEQAAGTRDLDRMGGLIRPLAGLSVLFLVGCLAIAALPPFNGFVSEWLILQALLRSTVLASADTRVVFALCGAALALTAALAVTCFVKCYAMGFLGTRRGDPCRLRLRRGALAPLAYLAIACLLLGILPTYVVPALSRAVAPLTGANAAASLVPPFFTATPDNHQLPGDFLAGFHALGAQVGAHVLPGRGLILLLRSGSKNPVAFAMSPAYSLAALLLLLGVSWGVLRWLTRRRQVQRGEVWAGGIPHLLPEMSYTATGFSNPVRVVFQAVFRPHLVQEEPQIASAHFRTAIRRRRDESHLAERWFQRPIERGAARLARAFARAHHGRTNIYAGYILFFLVVVLILFRLA
ncbi:MAG: proton-conducting transporter membrane subunit [Terriglobales bacterium]